MTPVCPFVKLARPDDSPAKKTVENPGKHVQGESLKRNKRFSLNVPQKFWSRIMSWATWRRSSAITPAPNLSDNGLPRAIVDDKKKSNNSLSEEVGKLRAQVEELTRRAQLQETELESTTKQLKEAVAVAEVIKSLTAQLKDLAEKLPVGAARTRNKNRTTKVEPTSGDERIQQDEPGVYITLVSLPGGAKDLKRVRFSRKRFSEKQAEQWWQTNRARVYQQYNIPIRGDNK